MDQWEANLCMHIVNPDHTDGAARVALSRDVIVREALAVLDESGAGALSMRKLGQRLGVQAMSLYSYVSGREDLLEAVVTYLLQDVVEGLDENLTQTWQGYLQALAHQVRRISVDHPKAFPLVATRHPATPWLRPPLRSVHIVEDMLANLSANGFNDTQMVSAYRSFSSFLLGQLLLEAATHGANTGPAEEPLNEGDAQVPNQDAYVDLADAPIINRLRPKLSEDHSTKEFEIGLETLLDRLDMELSL